MYLFNAHVIYIREGGFRLFYVLCDVITNKKKVLDKKMKDNQFRECVDRELVTHKNENERVLYTDLIVR